MVLGKGNTVVWTRLSVGRGIFFAGILLSRCWCIAKGGVRVYLGLDFDSNIQFTGVGFIAQISPGVF